MKKLFDSCFKRVLLPCLTAALVLLAVGTARASTFNMTIQQEGSNVVASGSGTISFSGLSFTYYPTTLHAQINPLFGIIGTGSTSGSTSYQYTGISGPASFGNGGYTYASSATGDAVAVVGLDDYLLLPVYNGGGTTVAFTGTATFDGQSLSSLGITPGTYTWTWDHGANSFVLDIPSPAAEPGSLLLLGIVLLAGLWLERRRILCCAAQC